MSEKRLALLGTIFLHVLLLVSLVFVKYGPEIQFHRIEVLEFGYSKASNNTKYISPKSRNHSNQGEKSAGSRTNMIPEKVDLPNKISSGEEELYAANSKFTAYNQLEMDEKVGSNKIDSDIPESVIKGMEENNYEEAMVNTSSDYLSSLSSTLEGGDGSDGPFLLEGDILTRSILNKVIPEYPEGLQKISRVKIKFEVSKQGYVNNLLVTQKADPQLEKISINALKQWRFSSLNNDIIQVGYITFIFQLK